MSNDINKLRRLMRTANYIRQQHPANGNMSFALSTAWWFESFRDALANGFARFTYYKKDGSTRTALGTRSPSLIPVDKLPQGDKSDGSATWEDSAKAIPYFDLDKNEWRSFSVLNFASLDKVWRFEQPKNPWISVEERLPERMTSRDSNGVKIIHCCSKDVFGYDASYKIGRLVCYNHESEMWESHDVYTIGEITHWMPIPELPKE